MKVSLVMLTDKFLKVHLKKLKNAILGASIVTNLKHNLAETEQPWQGTDTIPCPCSIQGTWVALPRSHMDRTILTCSGRLLHEAGNQLGFGMSHPEHPATMTAQTCSCDRKGHCNSISHFNYTKIKGYSAQPHLPQEQSSQLKNHL